MGIGELASILGVSAGTIRNNRNTHPLYSKALKMGGSTSRLKWRRADVAAYLGVDELPSEPVTIERSVGLARAELDMKMRESEVAAAISEIRAILRRLESGVLHTDVSAGRAKDPAGLTLGSRRRLQRRMPGQTKRR
ncbi:hypothetical protein SAMN05421642_102211 [Rhodococcoides kyotonense]|uniref:Helix-turn-helix domain-containing protein n=2 Tax=Rhodococcoides kyotonense TaxID=398843 RepID=A0A239E7C8_9NOCA|nr:hypothetical protein SAMN05421642_102211 [Rhodococcus kyotonensis]